jgi:hypothetical protein
MRRMPVKVEELLDLEEIRRLRTLYSHYYDGAELDALVELFTEDAVCEFGPRFGGDWVGRDEIRAKYAVNIAREGDPFEIMHAVANHWIEITGPDSARGRCYLLDLRCKVGVENPMVLLGIYDDTYRRVDGAWRIARTRIDFLWPQRILGDTTMPTA